MVYIFYNDSEKEEVRLITKLMDKENKFSRMYVYDTELLLKLEKLVQGISSRYDLDEDNVIGLIRKRSEHMVVPVSIFNSNLSPLEALVYYLSSLNFKFSEIAKILNRDNSTIIITYNRAVSKKPKINVLSKISIPIEIFGDRMYSVLEALCIYLRKRNMKYSEISNLIAKDERTIWTVVKRANNKVLTKKEYKK